MVGQYTADRESETHEVWRSQRESKKAEDAAAREKFQGFRAPETSASTPRFIPPKQQPGESLGTYMSRVKKAKADFEESVPAQSQKRALEKMEEPK